jgi:hypothetical protein
VLVTLTLEHRQRGVFCEPGVGVCKMAQVKRGTARRDDDFGVATGRAESRTGVDAGWIAALAFRHDGSVTWTDSERISAGRFRGRLPAGRAELMRTRNQAGQSSRCAPRRDRSRWRSMIRTWAVSEGHRSSHICVTPSTNHHILGHARMARIVAGTSGTPVWPGLLIQARGADPHPGSKQKLRSDKNVATKIA